MPTSRSSVTAAMSSQINGDDTSATSVRVCTPWAAATAAAESSSRSRRRATITTLAPWAPYSLAMAAPRPTEAPTTSAHGPYRSAKLGKLQAALGAARHARPPRSTDGVGVGPEGVGVELG